MEWGDQGMEMETNLMKGYTAAYKLACEELAKRSPSDVCTNAQVAFEPECNAYRVRYLGVVYRVHAESGAVEGPNADGEVSATVKVLLLHYLLHAKNRPLSGNLISFRDLKNGAAIYYPVFHKRAVTPLIKTFGNCFEDLYAASAELGGVRAQYGHASVTVDILPRIPVTYVLWEGEDDIPASGTILFDDSVEYYLPAEDIVFAGSFGVYELMRLKQAGALTV